MQNSAKIAHRYVIRQQKNCRLNFLSSLEIIVSVSWVEKCILACSDIDERIKTLQMNHKS